LITTETRAPLRLPTSQEVRKRLWMHYILCVYHLSSIRSQYAYIMCVMCGHHNNICILTDFVNGFANTYSRGMPGPSYSWSAFSDSAKDAASRLQPLSSRYTSAATDPLSRYTSGAIGTDTQVLPMVLERLDESLVLMCDYLRWSLADAGTSTHT
jgi:hypothetical protein